MENESRQASEPAPPLAEEEDRPTAGKRNWKTIETVALVLTLILMFAFDTMLLQRTISRGGWISPFIVAIALTVTALLLYYAYSFLFIRRDYGQKIIAAYIFLKFLMLIFTGFFCLASVALTTLFLLGEGLQRAWLPLWILPGALSIASIASRVLATEKMAAFKDLDQRLQQRQSQSQRGPSGSHPLKTTDLPWTLAGLVGLIVIGLALFLLFATSVLLRRFHLLPLAGLLAVMPLIIFPLKLLLEVLEILLGKPIKPRMWKILEAAGNRAAKGMTAWLASFYHEGAAGSLLTWIAFWLASLLPWYEFVSRSSFWGGVPALVIPLLVFAFFARHIQPASGSAMHRLWVDVYGCGLLGGGFILGIAEGIRSERWPFPLIAAAAWAWFMGCLLASFHRRVEKKWHIDPLQPSAAWRWLDCFSSFLAPVNVVDGVLALITRIRQSRRSG